MSIKNKGFIIPVIVVIVLVVLIVSASYAYFTGAIAITSSTTNANTTFENVGIVTLKSVNNLSLDLTGPGMMQSTNDITYYATLTGTPSTTPYSEIIATAYVEGNGTMYCDYKMDVSVGGTNNLYTAFRNMSTRSVGQLVLNVDGVDYDFYNTTFPFTISKRIEGLKEGSNKDIYASFKIVNKKDVIQNDLKDKDITITFSVSEFKCHITG